MQTVRSGDATISYSKAGSGPTLVLVHGGFGDHENLWRAVRRSLEQLFTLVSVARRGRGESTTTTGHTVEDEAADVIAVINAVGGDVNVLAHSIGCWCALEAALRSPRVAKLILYEPPSLAVPRSPLLLASEEAAAGGDWDKVVEMFTGDEQAARLRGTSLWASMMKNAEATIEDGRVFRRYVFEPGRARTLRSPLLLLMGEETPQERCATSELARVVPHSRIVTIEGEGHMAMLTAPALFVETVRGLLLDD